MIPSIGDTVIYQKKPFHIQDRNLLNLTARIGEPDENGMVWDTIHVPFDEITIAPRSKP